MKKTGLVHVYTGDGKGKTTAAAGLAVRAAGSGLSVLFVQFFKQDSTDSGEKEFFRRPGSGIELIRSNSSHPIFTRGRTDEEALRRSIRETFALARERVETDPPDLLVLDEAVSAINGGWLSVDEVIEFLDARPASLEVVLTGRDAPVEVVKRADYVTEMLKIRHPFDAGLRARRGIEF